MAVLVTTIVELLITYHTDSSSTLGFGILGLQSNLYFGEPPSLWTGIVTLARVDDQFQLRPSLKPS